MIQVVQVKHVTTWQKGLDYCLSELEKAEELLREVLLQDSMDTSQNIKQRLTQTPKFNTYLKGISEIYKVSLRIKITLNEHNETLTKASSPLTTLFVIDRIQNTWNNLIGLAELSVYIQFQSMLNF